MRKMKDSGIEWIGEIPESWDIVRLKALFDFGKGLPITKENLVDEGIPVISYGQIHAKFNNGVTIDDRLLRFVPETYLQSNPSSLTKTGDILVADTSEDLEGCGNAVQVDREMQLFAGYHTIILQSKEKGDNRYLAYVMLTDNWRSQLRGKASGVKLFSISKKMLSDCFFIYPPTPIQNMIANYLDRQCTHIDNIIEKTKASIEEYKKLHQAVITQAVTKGVRGDRPMKVTGFDWLLQIPAEWTMGRGKNLFFETNNRSESGEEELLTVSQYTGVTPRSQKNVNMFEAETLEGYKICEIGDIAANTMWLWAGAIGVSEYYGVISPSYNIYRQKNDAYNSKYLDYLLRIPPIVQLFASLSTGIRASRLRLYPEQFLNIYYPLPPLDEQAEIVAYLQEKIVEVDKLITKKEQFLTELESYKKSMIYEYVTGKKEVPQA